MDLAPLCPISGVPTRSVFGKRRSGRGHRPAGSLAARHLQRRRPSPARPAMGASAATRSSRGSWPRCTLPRFSVESVKIPGPSAGVVLQRPPTDPGCKPSNTRGLRSARVVAPRRGVLSRRDRRAGRRQSIHRGPQALGTAADKPCHGLQSIRLPHGTPFTQDGAYDWLAYPRGIGIGGRSLVDQQRARSAISRVCLWDVDTPGSRDRPR